MAPPCVGHSHAQAAGRPARELRHASPQGNPGLLVHWSSGPERLPKIVYLRFLGPVAAQTYSDDIILDETAPLVRSVKVGRVSAVSTAQSVSARRKVAYRVTINATDKNSGVASMQLSRNKRAGTWVSFSRSSVLPKSPKGWFVRVSDRAGNISKWVRIK